MSHEIDHKNWCECSSCDCTPEEMANKGCIEGVPGVGWIVFRCVGCNAQTGRIETEGDCGCDGHGDHVEPATEEDS